MTSIPRELSRLFELFWHPVCTFEESKPLARTRSPYTCSTGASPWPTWDLVAADVADARTLGEQPATR